MKKEPDFEEAMERLDEIAETLSDGGASLEESLLLYSEGAKLLALCESRLTDAKLKIEALFPEENSPKG